MSPPICISKTPGLVSFFVRVFPRFFTEKPGVRFVVAKGPAMPLHFPSPKAASILWGAVPKPVGASLMIHLSALLHSTPMAKDLGLDGLESIGGYQLTSDRLQLEFQLKDGQVRKPDEVFFRRLKVLVIPYLSEHYKPAKEFKLRSLTLFLDGKRVGKEVHELSGLDVLLKPAISLEAVRSRKSEHSISIPLTPAPGLLDHGLFKLLCRLLLLNPHCSLANAVESVKIVSQESHIELQIESSDGAAKKGLSLYLMALLWAANPTEAILAKLSDQSQSAIDSAISSLSMPMWSLVAEYASDFGKLNSALSMIQSMSAAPALKLKALIFNPAGMEKWTRIRELTALKYLRPPSQLQSFQLVVFRESEKNRKYREWRFFVPNATMDLFWSQMIKEIMNSEEGNDDTILFDKKLCSVKFTFGQDRCIVAVRGENSGDPPNFVAPLTEVMKPLLFADQDVSLIQNDQLDRAFIAVNGEELFPPYTCLYPAMLPVFSLPMGSRMMLINADRKANAMTQPVDYQEYTFELPALTEFFPFPAADPQRDFLFQLAGCSECGQYRMEFYLTENVNVSSAGQGPIKTYTYHLIFAHGAGHEESTKDLSFLRIVAMTILRHMTMEAGVSNSTSKPWLLSTRYGQDAAWQPAGCPIHPNDAIFNLKNDRFMTESSAVVLRNGDHSEAKANMTMIIMDLRALPQPFDVSLSVRSLWGNFSSFSQSKLAKDIFQISISHALSPPKLQVDFQLLQRDQLNLAAACIWLVGRSWGIENPQVTVMPDGNKFNAGAIMPLIQKALMSAKLARPQVVFGDDYPLTLPAWTLQVRLSLANNTWSRPLPMAVSDDGALALLASKPNPAISWHYSAKNQKALWQRQVSILPEDLACALHRIFYTQHKIAGLVSLRLEWIDSKRIMLELGCMAESKGWADLPFPSAEPMEAQINLASDEDYVIEGVAYRLCAVRGGEQHELMGPAGLGRILMIVRTSMIRALQSLGFSLTIIAINADLRESGGSVLQVAPPRGMLIIYLQTLMVPHPFLSSTPKAISLIRSMTDPEDLPLYAKNAISAFSSASEWTLQVTFQSPISAEQVEQLQQEFQASILRSQLDLEGVCLKNLFVPLDPTQLVIQVSAHGHHLQSHLDNILGLMFDFPANLAELHIETVAMVGAECERFATIEMRCDNVLKLTHLWLQACRNQPGLVIALPTVKITPNSICLLLSHQFKEHRLQIAHWLILFFRLSDLPELKWDLHGEPDLPWISSIDAPLPEITLKTDTKQQQQLPAEVLMSPSIKSSPLAFWVWSEEGWRSLAKVDDIPSKLRRSIDTLQQEWLIADAYFFDRFKPHCWNAVEVTASKLDAIWPQLLSILREKGFALQLLPPTPQGKSRLQLFYPDGVFEGSLRIPSGVVTASIMANVLEARRAPPAPGAASMLNNNAYRLYCGDAPILNGESLADLITVPFVSRPLSPMNQLIAPFNELVGRFLQDESAEPLFLRWQSYASGEPGRKLIFQMEPDSFKIDSIVSFLVR